jgi:S-adenosyl-L-methionine hydrolase (adenosine-forming)
VTAVSRPIVTFLSDFGNEDPFVGICHAVIVRIAPDAEVIHLTHGIEPQSVPHGARVLAASIDFLPVGVHLCVVDPGVGSERRALCLRSADGRLFVGPDNGLLVPAAERCGGIQEAYAITSRAHMLPEISRTFHGRDVFAPASAHLAAGVPPSDLGPAVELGSLHRPHEPGFTRDGPLLDATVQHVDRFGNLQLSVSLRDLGDLFRSGRLVEVQCGDDRYYATCALTFADVPSGELVLYEDSEGWMSLAINRGRAAQLLDAAIGARMRIDFDPHPEQEERQPPLTQAR